MNNKFLKSKNAFEALITYSSDDDDENKSNEGNEDNETNKNDSDNSEDSSDNDTNSTNYDNKHTYNFRNSKFDKFLSKKKLYLKKNIYENKNNHKKIMCQNYLDNNFCTYNEKCLYAHNKDEQKIDIKRNKIFDILNSSNDLSNLEYYKNKDIYKELQLFTKICNDCVLNKCTGGNNCKFGSPYEKYVICYDDLNYGSCNDNECNKIHLTKRNLKPQYNNIYSSINKPPINNLHMLTTFMNNINILNTVNIPINNTNTVNNDIINQNNDIIDSDTDCDKSIFIDKFNFVDDEDINANANAISNNNQNNGDNSESDDDNT